jgi:hypothetical protein
MSYQRFCGLEDAINIHGSHHYLEIWAAYWWKRSQAPIRWCIHSAIEKRIHCTWRAGHRCLTGTLHRSRETAAKRTNSWGKKRSRLDWKPAKTLAER